MVEVTTSAAGQLAHRVAKMRSSVPVRRIVAAEPGVKHSELPIGFHPVTNRRISVAIASETLELMSAGVDEYRAQAMAIRHIARQLPPPPFRRRHRAPRPSKSDNPDYRKLNPARAMACAG